MTHDKEGNITIVDRIKDMIKVRNFLAGWGIFLVQVKGLQVSPTELEEVLAKVDITSFSHELELG